MNAEEHLTEGERAKRHLRVAQALAALSKTRNPSLKSVQDAVSRLQVNQPAVAMAIILAQAKRQPLHERGEWLKSAAESLRAYRLGDAADQKEADLAHEQIERELGLHKAELTRLEKMRERFSLALLCLLVASMIAGLVYLGYTFWPTEKQESKEPAKHAAEKQTDKKIDPKTATAKTTPASNKAETKPAETDKKTAKPTGK
jgi:hypothetical protein